jgi:hypothetical protein
MEIRLTAQQVRHGPGPRRSCDQPLVSQSLRTHAAVALDQGDNRLCAFAGLHAGVALSFSLMKITHDIAMPFEHVHHFEIIIFMPKENHITLEDKVPNIRPQLGSRPPHDAGQ